MRIFGAVALAAVALASTAAAQSSPFSEPPAPRAGQYSDTSSPTLGDIMLTTQLRHIKVWFAGRTGNWRLLQHEVATLQDTLIRAALLYQGIPIEEVTKVDKPVMALIEAAKDKDSAKFQAAYGELNNACNSCHKAGGVEFIRIQTPNASPFGDQAYPSPPQ